LGTHGGLHRCGHWLQDNRTDHPVRAKGKLSMKFSALPLPPSRVIMDDGPPVVVLKDSEKNKMSYRDDDHTRNIKAFLASYRELMAPYADCVQES